MIDDVATDSSTGSDKSRTSPSRRARRVRMTGKERREQLLDIGRALFADKGFEGTSVEEIAARAGVSKPVVYEHFGG
ncbi:helix-turn-helix transcriptional regulator, partial [Streptomyces sp. SID7982]|nr:helix-turn-helix transcriptional regulator [Streptomyces sp. SID7982]